MRSVRLAAVYGLTCAFLRFTFLLFIPAADVFSGFIPVPSFVFVRIPVAGFFGKGAGFSQSVS